jgi:nucleotide-binding universal stress UspA family protein
MSWKSLPLYIHPQKELGTLLKNYRIQSEQILENCEELGNNNGVEIKTVIIEGDVASKIIQYAAKEIFDMVVMGRRGSGRFKEMVLGSVSEKVLHQIKVLC